MLMGQYHMSIHRGSAQFALLGFVVSVHPGLLPHQRELSGVDQDKLSTNKSTPPKAFPFRTADVVITLICHLYAYLK